MNNYLQINNKWLRVVASSYNYGVMTPEVVTRSLTSKATKTYAPSYQYWQFVARVKTTETGSYATWNDIQGWINSSGLTLVDFAGNSYTVIMIMGSDGLKQQQVIPVFDGADSFAYVPMRFEEAL